MKKIKRQNLYLSIIAIFLGIVVLFDYGLSNLLKNAKTEALLSSVDKSKIDLIEIINPGTGPIKLTKKDTKWYVTSLNEYEADASSVNDIWNVMDDLKASDIVSKNANNFKTYGLDDVTAINVKLEQGENVLGEFYIGSKGPSYNSQYLRLPDDNKVYLVNKNLDNIFRKEPDDFRDKTIVKIKSDDIESVLVAGTNISDLEKIKDKFDPFNANGFIDSGEATNEAAEQKREPFDISIKLKGNDIPVLIKVGKITSEGNYLVTTSISNQMYTVNSYVIESIVEAAVALQMQTGTPSTDTTTENQSMSQ